MHALDYIVLAIVFVILLFAVRGSIRRKRSGACCGGGSGCASCAGCAGCSARETCDKTTKKE